MKRTVAYMVNEHPFYLNMLRNSLQMLVSRLTNPVDIKVFLIKDHSQSTIERLGVIRPLGKHQAVPDQIDSLRELGAEIIEKEPLDSFFHANREYFGEIDTDSLLYIDADTFVFDDVNKLFDRDEDFMAVRAEWATERGFPQSLFQDGGKPIYPFSSGVMLWNNGWHKDWATQLSSWMKSFQSKEHPLGEWLYEQHRDCLLREEFAATAWIDSRKKEIRYGYFDSIDVQLMRYNSDFDKFGNQTIFHCYAPNWKPLMKRLSSGRDAKVPSFSRKKNV